jgi:hypothetical protein
MSLKWLTVSVLVAVATFVAHARAQKNELSGLIGRTFISDQGIKGVIPANAAVRFGGGLTFEINYARRIMGRDLTSLSLEVPFVANLDEDLNADVFLVPKDFKSYFLTPSARLNVFANQAVSLISFGADSAISMKALVNWEGRITRIPEPIQGYYRPALGWT